MKTFYINLLLSVLCYINASYYSTDVPTTQEETASSEIINGHSTNNLRKSYHMGMCVHMDSCGSIYL